MWHRSSPTQEGSPPCSTRTPPGSGGSPMRRRSWPPGCSRTGSPQYRSAGRQPCSYHHPPVPKGVVQICVLDLIILSPWEWDLCQAGHGDRPGGDVPDIFQIHQIRTVGPQEALVRLQLSAQVIQTADALQHFAGGQVKKQRPVDDLAVFQLLEPNPGDAAFTPQDDAVRLLLFTRCENGVHQPEKALLTDRL